MPAEKITDDQFKQTVLESSSPVIVDFYADWCAPCQALLPILDEISDEKGDALKVVKMNIEDSPEAPTKYGVRGVPTLMLFKDGQVTDTRIAGMSKKELSEWINGSTE